MRTPTKLLFLVQTICERTTRAFRVDIIVQRDVEQAKKICVCTINRRGKGKRFSELYVRYRRRHVFHGVMRMVSVVEASFTPFHRVGLRER